SDYAPASAEHWKSPTSPSRMSIHTHTKACIVKRRNHNESAPVTLLRDSPARSQHQWAVTLPASTQTQPAASAESHTASLDAFAACPRRRGDRIKGRLTAPAHSRLWHDSDESRCRDTSAAGGSCKGTLSA